MDTTKFSLFTLLLVLIFFVDSSLCALICRPTSCSDMGPEIRFPFRLKGEKNKRCGYPGFELSCTDQGETILSLPASGDFVVNKIDYSAQALYLNDPDSCLPERVLNFSAHGSPFTGAPGNKYTFYNCSTDWSGYLTRRAVPLLCLGNTNYMFLATTYTLSSQDLPPSCRHIPNVTVPLQLSVTQYLSTSLLSEDIQLIWGDPGCQTCEMQRLYCGFNSDTGLDIGCSKPPNKGLPRGAKYGIVLGAGIPGLVFMIGLVCYTCGRIRNIGTRRRSQNSDLSTTELNPRSAVSITGLDALTIESYPKTVLGESRRLPGLNNNTCPICLSEYQPKETLRTLPDCNHYFHASCVDEWLKLNGTCPMCRNMPESMTVTPCSSNSSTFSSHSETH